MKIKVCGMKYAENIQAVADLHPDYLGFIFYKKSPRYAFDDLDASQLSTLSGNIQKVGVFVNEEFYTIKRICDEFKITTIQLHGDESPQFCIKLRDAGFIVIKAFGMNENFGFNLLNHYVDCCDFFLFDTKTSEYGGSGKKFRWDLLNQYHLELPFFLSGGISPDDLDEIKKIKSEYLYAIDVNSRFEIEAGLKDVTMLNLFIKRIRDGF